MRRVNYLETVLVETVKAQCYPGPRNGSSVLTVASHIALTLPLMKHCGYGRAANGSDAG